MSAIPKRKMTPAEYLAIEREAERKSEFLDGEMFAMAGASWHHNLINKNLAGELFIRLKGSPCQTLSSDLRISVDMTGWYAYPDMMIFCGPPAFDPLDPHTTTNPTAIIEVLSPSTERYDRGRKFSNYQRIPSLTEYLLVAQDEPLIDRFVRQADDSWTLASFVGLSAILEFTSVPARIPLADVYAGVEFPEAAGR